MNVYIVWDQSRREHGEMAELLDVFLSKEDAETFVKEDVLYGVDEEDTSIEEREIKGHLPEIAVLELIAQVLANVRGGMRVVIGDRTPQQYDRADAMAGYITVAVRRALTKLDYIKEKV
jgi:hypothetical protein